jgi:trehalose-6-phosphate synthase
MRQTGGCWIGWPGTEASPEDLAGFMNSREPFSLIPISLTQAESDYYYRGFSN